jgi:outer membrane cobalamin receptor
MSFQRDTIKIREVVISSKKIGAGVTGFKKICVDSSVLRNYSNGTLADLISASSLIFVKSYGMGGTATPSFRGTGASHTQIAWNSINLNSPMLGQADLSLFPAGLADEIQIYSGGASMMLNSGGIGGIINLETKPVWKKETEIRISPGFGNYGRYTGLVLVKTGNANFQSVTKAFLQFSENDFRYLNTEIGVVPVWETRKNSQSGQQGFMQELYFRKTKNVASARIWYQSASRNLPSSMLSQQVNSGESQSDESLRSIVSYDVPGIRSNYFFTGGWISTKLNYSNTLASVKSVNLSNTVILKAGLESMITEHTKLKVVFDDELTFVNSNNYDHNISRNTITSTVSAERNGNNRFGTLVLIRGICDKNSILIPDFSAGFQFRIAGSKEYFLKANISRNSKIPTLNDLFWVPGGNNKLKNEYAFMFELSYEMKQKIAPGLNMNYDLSLFQNRIKDMIQWHPGEYSYFIADNIQNVNSEGIESSLAIDYKKNGLTTRFKAEYSFVKAQSMGPNEKTGSIKGKQIMYVPEHQAITSIIFGYSNFYSSWVTNFTGKRYITADNSKFMPAFLLNDILAGIKLNFKGSFLDISFNVDNLFNTNYQSIAHYPLPGRSYSLRLLLQIVK